MHDIANRALRLSLEVRDGGVRVALREAGDSGVAWVDAAYRYRFRIEDDAHAIELGRRVEPRVTGEAHRVTLAFELGGVLGIEHRFDAPAEARWVEERLVVTNLSARPITLGAIECGLRVRLTDEVGRVLPEVARDRFAAVPFLVRATDPPGHRNEFTPAQLLATPGGEPRMNGDLAFGVVPSRHRTSEAWAWLRPGGEGATARGLCVMKFRQGAMEWAALSTQAEADGVWLRLGGACVVTLYEATA